MRMIVDINWLIIYYFISGKEENMIKVTPNLAQLVSLDQHIATIVDHLKE